MVTENYLYYGIALALGALGGHVLNVIFNKMSKKDCSDCEMVKDLRDQLAVIKGILLELAVRAGIDTKIYKGLV